MLNVIFIVTLSAPNLKVVEEAYRDYLGYNVAARGKVSRTLASAWGAPASAGHDYLLMQPESGEEVYLRFIESEATEGYAPLRTFGWNCTEILVKDPDDLARRLADSPFRIIGPPRNLSSNEDIRAMQVIGPANEVLYLTRLTPGKAGFDLGSARTDVDRVFIVVLGGRDMKAMRDFYAGKMKLPVTLPTGTRISVLSRAHGMDPEHLHPLAVARLPRKFLIEIDEYPQGATLRPQRDGYLPPGLSLVSFEVDSIDALKLDLIQPPVVIEEWPYKGRRVAVTSGAEGELIELVETRIR
jgi:hypothetical protein